jgi:integrase/recombinase XerD
MARWFGMSALRQSLGDYLALRRSVGYKLESVARMLSSFVAFAERAGAGTITAELALSWATQPQQASPIWLAHRLSAVRGFARYLHALDPATEIPPADLLAAPGYQPAPPYLYSDADIAALLAAARRLSPPLQAATFETLLGLLAVTGLRIGEAMRLDRDDIDWDEKALIVRSSKFGRSREVVCHDSTIEALRTYSARRDQLCPRPASASFFVSQRGRRLAHHSIYATFHQLAGQAGLRQRPGGRPPRVHGLRHSFAVGTLLRWYRDGGDVQARLPLLSTYLGHVRPSSTYWYLTACPELLALAAGRLEASDEEQQR